MSNTASITKTGFSLIELIIALAIIGILSSITYPVYTRHLMKIHRIEAITTTLDIASQLEKYFSQNQTYSGFTNNPNNTKHYYFEIITKENLYLIKAVPINHQTKDQCGILSLDHLGNKQADSSQCWQLLN